MKSILAIAVGVAIFSVLSLIHQVNRGLATGVLFGVDGVVVAVFGGWWQWIPGLAIMSLAFVAVAAGRRVKDRTAWIVLATTLAILATVGSVVASAHAGAGFEELRPPQLWLIDGVAGPGLWLSMGLAVAMATFAEKSARKVDLTLPSPGRPDSTADHSSGVRPPSWR